MERTYRVACFTSHPIQYQAPLFRYLAGRGGLDLTVFFFSALSVGRFVDRGFSIPIHWDVPLLGGYRYVFLSSGGAVSLWKPWARGIRRALRSDKFDAVWVHGYSHWASLQTIMWAKRLGTKILFRAESWAGSGRSSRWLRAVKQLCLPRLFDMVDAFLAIGTANAEYYRFYGVPEERVFLMPYAVDNAFFQTGVMQARRQREQLRTALGLSRKRPVILFVSKLLQRKRAWDLLEAYRQLSPDDKAEPAPYLLLVGEGHERKRLQNVVRKLGWSSVRFLGFVNQTKLPALYDLADIFVLPSEREPWGLVVNEAMNAGKPLIVSDQVGAAKDLVKEGENGFVVRYDQKLWMGGERRGVPWCQRVVTNEPPEGRYAT